MGGDTYVHYDFRHRKLVETLVAECVAGAGLLALCPRTICASALVSHGPCQTRCGETWLNDLSLKPKMQEQHSGWPLPQFSLLNIYVF